MLHSFAAKVPKTATEKMLTPVKRPFKLSAGFFEFAWPLFTCTSDSGREEVPLPRAKPPLEPTPTVESCCTSFFPLFA